jgi:hypothetical protein
LRDALIKWTKIVIFDIMALFCVDLFFSLQKYNACQEKAVEQTFVVDSSRLLSFAVGYSIGSQNIRKLYPLPPPVSLPDVNQRNQPDGDVVEPFSGPDTGDGGGFGHQKDIHDVGNEHTKLQGHRCRGVACARDSLEKGHGEST